VPRNLDQLQYINEVLQLTGRHLDMVFFINLSEEESVKRISRRLICSKCKKVFIMGVDIQNRYEKCSHCQGEIVHREDDTEEGVKKRLKVYHEETLPVIEEYRRAGILEEIDGSRSVDEVSKSIISIIEKKS